MASADLSGRLEIDLIARVCYETEEMIFCRGRMWSALSESERMRELVDVHARILNPSMSAPEFYESLRPHIREQPCQDFWQLPWRTRISQIIRHNVVQALLDYRQEKETHAAHIEYCNERKNAP